MSQATLQIKPSVAILQSLGVCLILNILSAPFGAGLACRHLNFCCTLGPCVVLRWPCRGKPGLAAGWLTTVTGPALMMELDAMDHADITAALNAMRPRQAAELLEVRLSWGLLTTHDRLTPLPVVHSELKITVCAALCLEGLLPAAQSRCSGRQAKHLLVCKLYPYVVKNPAAQKRAPSCPSGKHL